MNKLLNRNALKLLFGNGKRPTESSFGSLIDSMVNTVDDGITKNATEGLALAPEDKSSSRVISFYESFQQEYADWTFDLGSNSNSGFTIGKPAATGSDEETTVRMFFDNEGKTGIATNQPLTDFHVKGISGSDSRIGTFILNSVAANGQWQDVITDLTGCHAYEIVAQVGKAHAGKYALVKATAISTFGKSKVSETQAHYGLCWNKIAIRFVGNQHGYKLQIKTRTNYGDGQMIKFHITKIWDDTIANLIP